MRRFTEEPEAPTEWLEAVMTKRIVVHLMNSVTIEGSLMAQYEDGILLRAAKLLGDGTQNGTAMAGETFIPRGQVMFVQLDV